MIFIAGFTDCRTLFRIEITVFFIDLCCTFFQYSKSMNNFFRHFSADFEIFEGALRLSTPHMIRRYADFAK